MTAPRNAKEMNALIKPFADRHISESDKASIRAKLGDKDQVARDWDALIAEAYALMKTGDPTSSASQDMARRWSAMGELITAGDPTIQVKGRAVWDDAMKDPATAAKMALNREIFAFVKQAIEHWKTMAK